MQKILSNRVVLAKYLFILLAAVLDVFGIGAFMYVSKDADMGFFYALYSFLMFAEAALMLICAFWIRKSQRIYWLGVILLAVNIISIIFDQLGIVDVAFAVFNGIILFILLIYRKEFIVPMADPDDA
jgi:hypothetical protein